MESCLLICNMNKSKNTKDRIIFIDAKNEIHLDRSEAYLTDKNINRIASCYWDFKDDEGFSKVVDTKEVLDTNNGNLSVQLYVKSKVEKSDISLNQLIEEVKNNQEKLNKNHQILFNKLNELSAD